MKSGSDLHWQKATEAICVIVYLKQVKTRELRKLLELDSDSDYREVKKILSDVCKTMRLSVAYNKSSNTWCWLQGKMDADWSSAQWISEVAGHIRAGTNRLDAVMRHFPARQALLHELLGVVERYEQMTTERPNQLSLDW